jgi:hypothetical protein
MFTKYGEITSAVLRKADEPDDSKAAEEGVEEGEGEKGKKEGEEKDGGEKAKKEKGEGADKENKQGDDKAAGAAEGKKPTHSHRGFGFVNFVEVGGWWVWKDVPLCVCVLCVGCGVHVEGLPLPFLRTARLGGAEFRALLACHAPNPTPRTTTTTNLTE